MTGLDKPESNHPLTAHRRYGYIYDTSIMPDAVWVSIGGDPAVVPCRYLRPYVPCVGDQVVMIESQGDYVVIGAVAKVLGSEPILIVRSPATCASGSPIPYATVDVDTAGGWDSTAHKYTIPPGFGGTWEFHAQFKQTAAVAAAGVLWWTLGGTGAQMAATANFATSNLFTGAGISGLVPLVSEGEQAWTQASLTFTPQNDAGRVGSNYLHLRYITARQG